MIYATEAKEMEGIENYIEQVTVEVENCLGYSTTTEDLTDIINDNMPHNITTKERRAILEGVLVNLEG